MEATQDIIDFFKRYSGVVQSAADEVKYWAYFIRSWIQFIVDFIFDFRQSVSAYTGYKVDEIKALFSDMDPPGESIVTYKNLLRNYLWVAVCLTMGTVAVKTPLLAMFSPIAEYLLTPAAMFFTAIFVLPYFMMNVFPYSHAMESDRRLYLMYATMVDYMLFGIVMGPRKVLFYAPSIILHSVTTGVVGYYVVPLVANFHRIFALIFVVGIPAGIDFVYGYSMNSREMPFTYILWQCAIIFVGTLDVQVKISSFRVGSVHSVHQAVSVVFLSLTHSGMFYLYASKSE